MRQPFAVLIPRPRLLPNGAWRRGTGRSSRQADRRMNMRPTGRLSDRSTRRQTPDHGETPGRRLPQGRESKMRAFIIATLIAAGLGLAGTTASLALPASGNAIEAAAAVNPLIEPVYWRHYYWHRWHRWHRWYHRW